MTNVTAFQQVDAFHKNYPPLKLPKTRDETLALAESYTAIAADCREIGSFAMAQDFDLLALMLRKRGKRMKAAPV